jgi:hypothetical protein
VRPVKLGGCGPAPRRSLAVDPDTASPRQWLPGRGRDAGQVAEPVPAGFRPAAGPQRSPRPGRPGLHRFGWPVAPAAGSPAPGPEPAALAPRWGLWRRRPAIPPPQSGPEVGRRQHRHCPVGAGGGLLHLVQEVAARTEVPGLQQRGVAGGLQLLGNPLRPCLIGAGVADEEVRGLIVTDHSPRRGRASATRWLVQMAVVGQGPAPGLLGCRFEVHVGSSLLVGSPDVEGEPGSQASCAPCAAYQPGSLAVSASTGQEATPSAAASPNTFGESSSPGPQLRSRPAAAPPPAGERERRGRNRRHAAHRMAIARTTEALLRERRTVNPPTAPTSRYFLYSSCSFQ